MILALTFYALISAPGLLLWWWLHAAIDPNVMRAIPAPRVRYTRDVEINPPNNDWRGFT